MFCRGSPRVGTGGVLKPGRASPHRVFSFVFEDPSRPEPGRLAGRRPPIKRTANKMRRGGLTLPNGYMYTWPRSDHSVVIDSKKLLYKWDVTSSPPHTLTNAL